MVAAAGAAGALGHDDVPGRVVFAAVAFCLISAGIYALNDVRDVEEDRLHPRKRFRPVAAGELGAARRSRSASPGCWPVSSCAWRSRRCWRWSGRLRGADAQLHVFLAPRGVLDIVAIAGGFVLRALAGGVAAPVTLSRWFVLVVTRRPCSWPPVSATPNCCGPARAAAGRAGAASCGATRPAACGCCWRERGGGAVRLLRVGVRAADVDDVPWRLLTAVPFTICLLRYGALVRGGGGEAPEEMLLSDRVLLLAGIAWLVLFALSVHAAAG